MKILITGGAGFIGSNLVEAFLKEKNTSHVTVLDNLSTGQIKNIAEFDSHPNFTFIEGDIRDYNTCLKACEGVDVVSHQAALGSVPRSIKDPITTNEVNISGTLNVFEAAKNQGIKRIVYAASSSTYGDNKKSIKVENEIGNPLSPYAITKYVSELYANVFADLYDMSFIGLRYFNVFGPKQNPNGAYAAVIPLFMKAALENKSPTINGDGSYSRDFTYVGNVIDANLKASRLPCGHEGQNQVYNVAFGERTTLKELWAYIQNVAGCTIAPNYGPSRKGDVPHSLADVSKAKKLMNYMPKYDVKRGLELTKEWMLISQKVKL